MLGLPLPRSLARGFGSSLADDVDHLGAYGDAQCDPLEVSVVPDLQLEGVELNRPGSCRDFPAWEGSRDGRNEAVSAGVAGAGGADGRGGAAE
ncbi:hypothetical protein, partial [Micromonospora orduensis]|uniref:hypothetical protein n=1 Tax=Micromonospora orduensis TaxID=1420891 RepID=UPI001ABFA56D